MNKNIPDDMVLVAVGVSVSIFFLWTHQYGIKDSLDFWIYFFLFISFFVGPMLYSSYVYYKKKKYS